MKKRRFTKNKVKKALLEYTLRKTRQEDYYVVDKEGNNIFEEYLLPNTKTEEEAWEQAELTLRTTQNFNRTHPEKMTFEHEEEKTLRIGDRVKPKKK